MSDRSWTCEQLTLPGLDSGTSSRASADGPTPSDWPASLTMPTSGPARVLASRSAQLASVADSPTSATSGPSGSASLRSAALQSSLASRLRARTDSRGSTLYRLTWKERATPLGRLICALRALAPRTSASGCTSWPTPTVRDHKGVRSTEGAIAEAARNHGPDLAAVASLAGWATPTSSQPGGSVEAFLERKRQAGSGASITDLSMQVRTWIHGEAPNSSPASTAAADRFQLNPHFSLWLQGYPTAWGVCAEAVTPSSRKSRLRS